MDRTEASTTPARGGDRTDRRRRGPVRVGPLVAALVIVGLGLAGPGWTSIAGAAGGSKPSHRAGSSGPALTLLAPPSIAGPSSPFSLRLGVPGASARTGLSLELTVYSHLANTTDFDDSLDGSLVESVDDQSDPIALSSLAADTEDPQGGVDLSVPVTAGGVTGTGTGPFTAHLDCPADSCGGVYPVLVSLKNGSTTVSRLITYLTYTDPPADVEPLRFALVVPLTLPTSTSAASAAPVLSTPALDSLSSLESALSGTVATVPLTLVPDPATVAALAADRRSRSKEVLSSLVALAAGPGRQTLCGSFVPVDAGALVTAALGAGELTEQVRRGAEVLDTVLHTAGCASGGAWVAKGPLTGSALSALSALGYDEVVVPPATVTGPTPSITPTSRFTLDSATPAGDAVLSDPGLSARLEPASPVDPALAADQLLAELELDYYEAPNTEQERGVVAALPTDWAANPVEVNDVLVGLQQNPMVDPVTLATLFSGLPVGGAVDGYTQPKNRRSVGVGTNTLPTRALATARSQLAGYAAAVAGGSTSGSALAAGLGDLLLEAESDQLSPAQQRAAVSHFEKALGQQLGLLSITSREVRLTASTGSVPITVVKTAPFPVEAVLTVSSDKIDFSPAGAQASNTECQKPVVTNSAGRSSLSSLCTFVHGTNAVYIQMSSRVSGDFRMSVTLTSPQSNLPLASGQITVRSLSTSAVAIALTAVAGAVLLGWWGRTLWRGRRSRRARHRKQGVTA